MGFLHPKSPHVEHSLSADHQNRDGGQTVGQSRAMNRRTSSVLLCCSIVPSPAQKRTLPLRITENCVALATPGGKLRVALAIADARKKAPNMQAQQSA